MKQAISLFLVSLCLAVLAAPTSGGTANSDEIQPLITTSELVVGMNRFAFGLSSENKLLENADVTLRIYVVEGAEAQRTAEVKAPYRAIRKVNEERSVHRHADGTEHVHGEESSIRGLYVAYVAFSRAGTWGLELIIGQPSGPPKIVRFAVTVLNTPATPAVGSAAPRSRNLIATDVRDLRHIKSG
jgi:hypothetical protein